MWFSENLAKIERHEIVDLDEEKESLESILAFVEQKKRQKDKKLAEVDAITEQTFQKSKNILKKDIKEILGFLKDLKSKLGQHIEEDELKEITDMWKQLDKNMGSKSSKVSDLKLEFKKLYSIMITDLNKLAGFISQRHKKVLEFEQETEHPEEEAAEKPDDEEPEEEIPEPSRKETSDKMSDISDLSKDTEIPEDDSDDGKDVL